MSMLDMKIIKTSDINKVPIKSGQLIFCKDSSFYFDYDNHTRLKNAGIGTQLANFRPDTLYDKDDIVAVEGYIFRCKEKFTSGCCFDADNWEKIGFGKDSETSIGSAVFVDYDNAFSPLEATNVQAAIDEVCDKVSNLELRIGEI